MHGFWLPYLELWNHIRTELEKSRGCQEFIIGTHLYTGKEYVKGKICGTCKESQRKNIFLLFFR